MASNSHITASITLNTKANVEVVRRFAEQLGVGYQNARKLSSQLRGLHMLGGKPGSGLNLGAIGMGGGSGRRDLDREATKLAEMKMRSFAKLEEIRVRESARAEAKIEQIELQHRLRTEQAELRSIRQLVDRSRREQRRKLEAEEREHKRSLDRRAREEKRAADLIARTHERAMGRSSGGPRERKGRSTGSHMFAAANMGQAEMAVERTGRAARRALSWGLGEAMDFEQETKNVFSKLKLFKTEHQADRNLLTAEYRRLGRDTQFTAVDAARGGGILAMAGYGPQKQVQVLEHGLHLAAASGQSMADSLDVALGIMGSFKLGVEDTGRVVDNLTGTFINTKTELLGLRETMKEVGSPAEGAQVPLEEIFAMAGVLGQNSITGTQAGTGIKNVLLGLQGATKRQQDVLKELKIDVKDEDGNLRSPTVVLQEVADAMDRRYGEGKGGVKRSRLLKELFGKNSLASATALITSFRDSDPTRNLALLQQVIANDISDGGGSGGLTKKVSTNMTDTTRGGVTRLNSAISDLAIETGNNLTPTIRALTDAAIPLMKAIGDVTKEHPEAVKNIGMALMAMVAFSAITRPLLMFGSTFHAFAGAAGMVDDLGTAAGKAAGKTGLAGLTSKLIGSAGLIAQVGTAAYALGKFADGKWGISDKVAETAAEWFADPGDGVLEPEVWATTQEERILNEKALLAEREQQLRELNEGKVTGTAVDPYLSGWLVDAYRESKKEEFAQEIESRKLDIARLEKMHGEVVVTVENERGTKAYVKTVRTRGPMDMTVKSGLVMGR